MRKPNLLLGYSPKCRIYPKKSPTGAMSYYLYYYLPGKGRVARPAGLTKKEAWYFKEEKESQLVQGIFDPFDLKRIPEDYRSRIERQRILLSEAIDQFMEATEFNRKEKTNRNTRYVLKQTLALLGDGYVDEISPVMLQRLASEFKRGGKTKAIVLSYFGIIKSLFNWLIDDLEALEGKNPVSRVKMPPKSEKVRDFLVRPEDVLKVLQVERIEDPKKVPISDLFLFLACTGCRLGEAIHAEWGDFDLDEGIWRIRSKPQCPTIDGLGWSPKWRKKRTIELLPEAIRCLKRITRRDESYGSVRVRGETQWYKADFVFTIEGIITLEGVKKKAFIRVSDLRRSWDNLLFKAGVEGFQRKDLRTYFNWLLVSKYGLSHKEAGSYIGNSELVNSTHYTPVSMEMVRQKIRKNQGGHFFENQVAKETVTDLQPENGVSQILEE